MQIMAAFLEQLNLLLARLFDHDVLQPTEIEEFDPPEPVYDEIARQNLAEILERLNDRYLDEIRGFDALNGVIVGAVIAVFVLFVDKVESFTWVSAALLIVPAVRAGLGFRGQSRFSPRPALRPGSRYTFVADFQADPDNAIANFVIDLEEDGKANLRLRDQKRVAFFQALALLIAVCLAAAALKAVCSSSEGPNAKAYSFCRSTGAKAQPRSEGNGAVDSATRGSQAAKRAEKL